MSCCLWVRRVPGEGRAKPLGALSRFVRPPLSGADERMLAQRPVRGNSCKRQKTMSASGHLGTAGSLEESITMALSLDL